MVNAIIGKPTTIRLNPQLRRRYDDLAKNTNRSRAFYINKALEESIDEYEYIYNLKQQVEDYRAGKLKTYSLDEVGDILGLDD